MAEQLYRQNEDGDFEPVEQTGVKPGAATSFEPGQQVVVPQAHGKAEAYDTWAAQSGNIDPKTGKYSSGPLKGKTYDQGQQKFDRMWISAPDSIKEKYASRSASRPRTDLAPSEQKAQGITPPMPQEARSADRPNLGVDGNRKRTYEDQKISRIRYYQGDKGVEEYRKRTVAPPEHDKDRYGVPDMIQRPASTAVAPTPKPAVPTFEELTKAPEAPGVCMAGLVLNRACSCDEFYGFFAMIPVVIEGVVE